MVDADTEFDEPFSGDLASLAATAERAARAAGYYILSVDRAQLSVAKKQGAHSLAAQLFTEVDHRSEAMIFEHLLPTMQTGNIAWLAEESADTQDINHHERFHKKAFWCVDPLDGTQAFLQGGSGFAVSVALISRLGIPLISVVYHPTSDICFRAIHGEKMCVPEAIASSGFTVYMDQSFTQHPLYDTSMAALQHIADLKGATELVQVCDQGAVMNACSVLRTPNSVYFKLPKAQTGGGCLWDYASTVGLFTAAGKNVTDMAGRSLRLNPPDTLFFNRCGVLFSSDSQVHNALLSWWGKFNLAST
ncbi:3'(2'),5'-bisphosphate nucleotidase CysQ [Reinekea sp. G2M2-21]|uniref:3'(2'),5'-bisphosphate nucleotidase CysQ family protein n=1 Tax=Reinekea sp. G2M2-21 TaxID=2788942 RepID=UPI0018AA6AB3|nr:inositol monophosphatase family protein [Reinekea sp. G2M2-21]